MSHVVFRIGPIKQETAPVNAYFVYPGDPRHQVFLGECDRSALMEIVHVYPPGDIVCESQLAPAADLVGLRTRALTDDEANQLGLMAFEMALPGQFTGVNVPSFFQFGIASEIFHQTSPWQAPFARETIGLALTGSIQRILYGRLLGTLGGVGGLVLFSSRDSIERIVNRFETGHLDQAADTDALGVTLEESPSFAVDAMRRAYRIECFPLPIKLEEGERVPLEDVDLLTLAASLRAVSALSTGSRESMAQLGVDQFEISAIAYW
jgi:hypothetical protein